MLNQVAVEALNSATYVENYMDYVENLPDAVQRHLSRIRDIDVQYGKYLKDAEQLYEQWVRLIASNSETDILKRNKLMAKIEKTYINAQELGDEKMQTVSQLQELIDHKSRQVDIDFKNLDYGKEDQQSEINVIGGGINTIITGTIQGGLGGNATSGLISGLQKNIRPQSPIVSSAINTAIKIENNQQTFSTNAQISNTTTTQRVGTPTISERSSNNNQNNTNNQSSAERTINKRSRRPRNENIIVNMDLGGNESNSANESGTQSKNNLSSNSTGNSGAGGSSGGTSGAGQKKSANNQSAGAGGKKKKRKTRGQGTGNQNNARDTRDDTPPPDPIDPDEPTYCLCDQISFGEMILCDNDLCPIEWFHFSCVALMSKPKGKWFCPNCRGDRPNVMKPKAQFLKELERYNKEKEEKT